MSFICDMIYFCYEKIFNIIILICVMTQVSHTWHEMFALIEVRVFLGTFIMMKA
jgi:hypothetical protein